ncbi:unnamed protein product [Bemisia tabaci]|uniref:Exonuclease domain-containing protein n=1 Tax=Bemisia tabaci TaxID=7038 RepID=A0A9P0F4D4_BEMTA|nr:unnamed protein product [Bemisia tabaci]
MDRDNVVMSRDFAPVFFDLERTGHRAGDEIIRIGAINKDNIFCRYILPKNDIPAVASVLTGLRKVDGKLHLRGEVKETTTLKEALQDFLKYLRQFNKPVIMIGHNCLHLDCRFLLNSLRQYRLLGQFTRIVQGFTDSVPLLKKYLPGRPSFNLKHLAVDILSQNSNLETQETHTDATTLIHIFRKYKVTSSQIFKFSSSVKDVLKREDRRKIAKKDLLCADSSRFKSAYYRLCAEKKTEQGETSRV